MTNLEKELEEAKKELLKLRKELLETIKKLIEAEERAKEQEKENEKNKEKIRIHEFIFANLGLSIDKINQIENKIIAYRESHKKELLSDDLSEQEYAISDMENSVSEYALELICGNVGDNVERYEYILKKDFGNIWNLLDETSKSFLISAKVMFASMLKADKQDVLDYSGVCLLVTKALELEVFKVFFKEYIQYLKEEKIKKYPKALLNETEIKADYLFSLGMVVHILGVKCGYRGSYTLKEGNSDYEIFFKYAKERLYEWSDTKIRNEILQNANFIERTRKDYRNPAAHTGHLTKVVCKECLDYIVDTEKQMKRMLENMKKRNKNNYF